MSDSRPEVDGTTVSSAELRARVKALQDGHDEELVDARTELAESLGRLDAGLRALRSRVVGKARRAGIVAGGVLAAGAAVAGAVVVAYRRLPQS